MLQNLFTNKKEDGSNKISILFEVSLSNGRGNIFNNRTKTRMNATVERLDYQIPVTQLKGAKGRYASSEARL